MNRLLSSARTSRHFKYGAPFFLFVFGGTYVLREFRTVRYDSDINPRAKKVVSVTEAFGDLEKQTQSKIKLKPENKSLEEELDHLEKTVDTDNWENKRGPRPWEGTVQERPVSRVVKTAPTVKELIGN